MTRDSIPWKRLTAEFLVIFAGVSLSLLADDWRQNRVERRQEQAILEEVRADLVGDSLRLAALAARLRSWDRAALWTIQHASLPIDSDSALSAIWPLFGLALYQPQRAGYLGARESGSLSLIRDPALRRQIVEYHERWQVLTVQSDARLNQLWRMAMDRLLLVVRYDFPADATSFMPFPNLRLLRDWDDFSRSDDLITRLQELGATSAYLGGGVEAARERNRHLLLELGATDRRPAERARSR